MATTSLWHIKGNLRDLIDYVENPDKTNVSNSLQDFVNVFSYDTNPNKTNNKEFVTSINCLKEIALQQMILTKKQFNKEDKYIAWHGYQSFKPDEVTPELCHEIGVKLAKQMWGDRFQVIVSTHLDKNHLHNHFCFNSVSFLDGKKYNYSKSEMQRLRNVSDELCKEYGLSVIETSDKSKAPNRALYFAEKNNEPTKYNLMRTAIDEAIKISPTPKEFVKIMRKKGYIVTINPERKYVTIRSINDNRNTRLKTLGQNYDWNNIVEQIYAQDNFELFSAYKEFNRESKTKYIKPKNYIFKGSFKSVKKVTGLKALYLYYCYRLGYMPKKNQHKPLSPELKQAWRKIDKLSNQVRLISKYNLNDANDVQQFIKNNTEQIVLITNQRNQVYNKLRRCKDENKIFALKFERDVCTKQLTRLRKEIRTANAILTDTDDMKKNIKAEMNIQHQRFAVCRTKLQRREQYYDR
ncbi:MAG: relaxase/mobilization nuclease domain-containing protein [Acetobacter sp.]|nr:relaxase/mobilization nuclease domain-containing protein [Bacteroides sp.]MCM1342184.1 relaxase/mobilization nuclease domain-containing protein [Acetobacter sp.]MCM1433612.1 relaxase/mobilization nuclease domain-containing protein [Clostridiales bacterium]